MIWKKSSSIVKWIFFISIIEICMAPFIYTFAPSMSKVWLFGKIRLGNFFIVFEMRAIFRWYCFSSFNFTKDTRKYLHWTAAKQTICPNFKKTRKTVKILCYFLFYSLIFCVLYGNGNRNII